MVTAAIETHGFSVGKLAEEIESSSRADFLANYK
jgi:hypothetical protein